MPHIAFPLQIASRFLYLRPVFQGLARWVLALRNFRAISSKLIPALPPPPPIPSLDAPTAFSGLRDGFVSPPVSSIAAVSTASGSAITASSAASAISIASAEFVAIESQSSFFSSPISAFQSSLMLVTPDQLPDLVISIFILLSIISASLVILPKLFKTNLINTAKISSAFTRTSVFLAKLFRTNPIPNLVPACVPPVFSPVQLVICLVSLLGTTFWTGLVRLHLSSPMTLLTVFVAHVRVIFHLGLDHVDSHQWANPGFGMSISREFCAKKDSHSETVDCHLPRGVEDMDHPRHPDAT